MKWGGGLLWWNGCVFMSGGRVIQVRKSRILREILGVGGRPI